MKHGVFKPHVYRTLGGWVVFQELPADRVARGFGGDVREACADFTDTVTHPRELAFRRDSAAAPAPVPQLARAPR